MQRKVKPLYVNVTEQMKFVTVNQRVDIDITYTQFYDGAFAFLDKLRSIWSIKYLYWWFLRLDDQNIVTFKKDDVQAFIIHCEKNGIQPPTTRTMLDVRAELIKNKLIFKTGKIAVYTLNPVLFWRSEVGKRRNMISSMVFAGQTPHIPAVTNKNEDAVPQTEQIVEQPLQGVTNENNPAMQDGWYLNPSENPNFNDLHETEGNEG